MASSTRNRLESRRQTAKLLEFMQQSFQQMQMNGAPFMENILDSMPQTPTTLQSRMRKNCRDLWKYALLPFCSIAEYHSLIQRHNVAVNNRANQMDLHRQRQLFLSEAHRARSRIVNIPPSSILPGGASHFFPAPDHTNISIHPQLLSTPVTLEADKLITTSGRITLGFDPYTKEPLPRPLSYSKNIRLSDFSEILRYFPNTEKLDVYETFKSTLDVGQKSGFDKENYGEIFKQIIGKFFPSHVYTVQNLVNPNLIAEAFIGLINVNDTLNLINSAISALTRKHGQPVSIVYNEMISLLRVKISHQEPFSTEKAINDKVMRLAKESIFNFVPSIH